MNGIKRCLFAGLVLLSFQSVMAVQTRFKTTGNWADPARWDNGVPGPNDLARLQDNATATINSNVGTIGGLNLRGNAVLGGCVINIENGGSLVSDGSQFFGINRVGNLSTGDATLNIYTGGSAAFSGQSSFAIGYNGADAYVNVKGGTLTANQRAAIGTDNVSKAFVTIENNGIAIFNAAVQIGAGDEAEGVLTLNSGTMEVNGELRLTDNATATGVLNVNGGILDASDQPVLVRGGVGTITQTGGVMYAKDLLVGHLKGSTGLMNMSGGSNVISGDLILGNQSDAGVSGATGELNMSGGWMEADAVQIGNDAGTEGQLTLRGKDTYLMASTLSLGNESEANVSSTLAVEDGLFEIHNLVANGDSSTESISLSGGVLKLSQADGSTAYDDLVDLIADGVLTWSLGTSASLAESYKVSNATQTWTNTAGVVLYADTSDSNYSYVWAQAISSKRIRLKIIR